MPRAVRRSHARRLKRRARWLLRAMYDYSPAWVTPRAVGRRAVSRAPCSCWMCGNPRRYLRGPTRQERRAAL